MMKQGRPRRPLTAQSLGALNVLATTVATEMRLNDFELLMSQRGFNAQLTHRAIVRLERVGWVSRAGGMLHISPAGRLAITEGIGVPPPLRAKRRTRSRMPPGLFSS